MGYAVALSFLLSFAFVGCSSGGDSSATYEADAFEVWVEELATIEGESDTYADALEGRADAWDELHPPKDLRDEHDAWVNVQREAAELLRGINGEVSPGSDKAKEIAELEDVFEDASAAWADAFAEIYRLRFYRMAGASMEPSLSDGDALKVTIYQGGPIERGAIIVFTFHLDPEREIVKRVIGLPGDTVEVKDGGVLIDGTPLVEDYLQDTPNYTYGPKTVPASHYFVLGDNRRNSFDSHAYGLSCAPEQQCDFVPQENIIGVLPADAAGASLRGE